MDSASDKAKQWISDGKDPRSAYWQVALESILEAITDYLEPGRLSPVPGLADDDLPLFLDALEVADLSPNLQAAFLAPPVAGKITPPEVYTEVQRIEPQQPSCKILIARPGEETRLLCAEFSPRAHTPGADIFQAGDLLGSYNFKDRPEFLTNLPKILRTHLWEKGPWTAKDHRRYTLNWFESVLTLNKATVAVNTDMSFFHTPSLIKSDRVEAIFTLLGDLLCRRAADPANAFSEAVAATRAESDADLRQEKRAALVETALFDLLAVMKTCELIPFAEFTAGENEQFKQETAKTIRFVAGQLA